MHNNFGVACILNYPSHYRQNIYLKMEKELNCDFFFGDIESSKIKKADYNLFKKKVTDLKTIKIGPFNWIKNSIRQVLRPYQTFILIGDPFCLSTWLFLIMCKLKGKKSYLWTHGWYGDESLIKKLLKKIFFNLSDGLFLYGNYAKNLMLHEGFQETKLHVIFNSLDYDTQLKIRNNIDQSGIYSNYFGNTNPTLIFVGRLTKVKQLHYLIEILKEFKKQGEFYNLVLIGEGPELKSLKELANRSNIEDSCWFYGACYDETELSKLIYNADLCVSPGNVGLTAMHSLMYGTPVITHNNFPKQMPEFEAIEKGVTGDFFKQDDIENLLLTIRHWQAQKTSRTQIRKDCFNIIDLHYNPNYQLKIISEIIC